MPGGRCPGMKASLLLLALGAALLLAGTASADPILDVIYHGVTTVETCADATVQGSAGVGFELGIPPTVTVGIPAIVPPSPDCLLSALP